MDIKFPDVLLSGDHQKIAHWNKMVSLLVTFKKRKDLIQKLTPSLKQQEWSNLIEFYQEMSLDDRKTLQIENLDSELNLQLGKFTTYGN
jgi:hypothetical protein